MMLVASRIAAILLATTFVAAGAAKLIRYPRWRSALEGYRLAAAPRGAIAMGVPIVEVAVALSLVFLSQAVGAALALVLLALFSAAIARAASRGGRRVPCGCFGGAGSRDYRLLLARNAVLSAAAAVVLLEGSDRPLSASISGSDVVPVVLVTAGVGLIAIVVAQTVASLRGPAR